jgi:hypothetical protein
MDSSLTVLMQEFGFRKAAMLNLETRQLVLFIVFQALFVMFCGAASAGWQGEAVIGITVAATLVLAHLLAIHFKMLLLAKYFMGLEKMLTEQGQKFMNWDTEILPQYIFHWGNFFLIPAALVGVGMILQFSWMVFCVAGVLPACGVGGLLLVALLSADVGNLVGRFRTDLITFRMK